MWKIVRSKKTIICAMIILLVVVQAAPFISANSEQVGVNERIGAQDADSVQVDAEAGDHEPVDAQADDDGHVDAQAEEPAYHLFINGEEKSPQDPVIMNENRLYIALRFVLEQWGAQVEWSNELRQVTIDTPLGDTIILVEDWYKVSWNDHVYLSDVSPFIENNRAYVPLRMIGELLHADVRWDHDTQSVYLDEVPLYTVVEEDTWETIGEQVGLSVAHLKELNESHAVAVNKSANDTSGLDDRAASDLDDGADFHLIPGMQLRVIVPDIIKNKSTYEELYLLARIIHVEAGYESFEGQVAVGNVIMNRVKDERFPNTIHDVIFAPNQFPPAHKESFATLEPRSSAIVAAKQALNNVNYVADAVYFYNPRIDSNRFFTSLTTVADIGSHRFAK